MTSRMSGSESGGSFRRMCHAANRMTRAEYRDRRAVLRFERACILLGSVLIGIILTLSLVHLLPAMLTWSKRSHTVVAAVTLAYFSVCLVIFVFEACKRHRALRELEYKRDVEDATP